MGCRPSQCILTFIVLSTALSVLACLLSALLLYFAPEEPWPSVYNGGDYIKYPALVFLLTALFALLVSFVGLCGLVQDSKVLLMVFSICAMVVAGLELAGGGVVLSFAYNGEIRAELENVVLHQVKEYTINSTDSIVENLQIKYECCGAHNYTDWKQGTLWQDETNGTELVPQACCKPEFASHANCTDDITTIQERGCAGVLFDRLYPVVDGIFALLLVAAFLEVISSLNSCYGAWLIKKYQKYDII